MSDLNMSDFTPEMAWAVYYDPLSALSLHVFERFPRRFTEDHWHLVEPMAIEHNRHVEAAEASKMQALANHEWPRSRGVRPSGRREDGEALRAYVDAGYRVSRRERQVYDRCVGRQMSLDACAAELGVARTTVRTHLHRLRVRMRRVTPRAAGAGR